MGAPATSSQRDSLTARRRSIAGRAQAKARKDRGELPGFMRKVSQLVEQVTALSEIRASEPEATGHPIQ